MRATTPQVSGLMLANHTSIAYLFERIMKQFDKLYNKQAFLDNYKRQPMFEDSFAEVRCPCATNCLPTTSAVASHPSLQSQFDDSYEIVQGLIDEYKAAESDDYLSWSGGVSGSGGGASSHGVDASAAMYGSIGGGATSSRAPLAGVDASGMGGLTTSASYASAGVGGPPRRASSVSALGGAGSGSPGGHG